jgi:hypothetical protein
MIIQQTVHQNIISFSILFFIIVLCIIHYIKPNLIYNKDGSYKPFGIGFKNKTVVPIWLVSIILAIFSYLFFSKILLQKK